MPSGGISVGSWRKGTANTASISVTTATISATRSALTSFIILQIISVEFVRENIFGGAVIVERNLYAYYRLPTSVIRTSNSTQSFYVLQCPFRSMFSIPKPHEMGVCAIVGRYRELRNHKKGQSSPEAHVLESAPVQLFTKVEYGEPLKTRKFVKIVKVKNVKTPTPLLTNPFKLMTHGVREMFREKPKIRIQQPIWDPRYDIPNNNNYNNNNNNNNNNYNNNLKPIKYLDIRSSEELSAENNSNGTIVPSSIMGNSKERRVEDKSKMKEKFNGRTRKERTSKDKDKRRDRVSMPDKRNEKDSTKSLEFKDDEFNFDFHDDDDDDDDVKNEKDEMQTDATNNYSPLRLLNVQDAINKLKLHVPVDHGDTIKNAEKFFAELNDYKRGFHSANYHNVYHRDELYNDHIIYDDLQQMGNYDHKENVTERQLKTETT